MGNLTFSGTLNAAYSAPTGYTLRNPYGSVNYLTTTTIGNGSDFSFFQLFDNTAATGDYFAEAALTFSSSNSECGLCFLNADGTGFSLIVKATSFTLRKESFYAAGTTISTLTGMTNSGTGTVRVEFNASTGAITVKKNGTTVLTGSYTDVLSGLRPGLQDYRDAGGAGSYSSFSTGANASVTIDSYPATVRSGETGIAYTTTGLSSVTGITIGSLAATGISDTAGDGAHSIPALTDGVAHELYGTRTVTITGTGGAPTVTRDFQPPVGLEDVTLSGTLNTSQEGGLYLMSPAPVVNDQIVCPPGLYDAQGNLLPYPAGTYLCWHIEAATKIARSYSVILGEVGGGDSGSIVSIGLTSSGLTSTGASS